MYSLILFSLLTFQALVLAEDEETLALKFLNQYHYISQSRSGNHDVSSALRNFQRFAGLPVTGKIDGATLKQMKKPRCGVPDNTDGRRFKRYATATKWASTDLTYYLQYGADLSHRKQDYIFHRALKFWADVSSLSFRRASPAQYSDIKISFGRNTHRGTSAEGTCDSPFDGKGKVLAHAYFPEDGRAHFDEDEEFTHNVAEGTNLLWVATHEFGHSLGLEHSDVKGAIMYPYYTGYVENMKLHSDDIRGIRSLYGTGGTEFKKTSAELE